MLRSLALALLLAAPLVAGPGKYNKVLSPGDAAPGWNDLTGTDGKKHSLADLKDKDVVVLVFTCNTCPVAMDYEPRLIAFAKDHPRVAVVAVNSNTGKGESLDDMARRAKKKEFPFPYLADPEGELATKYGAMFTPEFFVLDKDRKVVYTGAMDDKSPPGEPKAKHLEAAVAAALAGKKPDTAETSAAAGCKIRLKKKDEDK